MQLERTGKYGVNRVEQNYVRMLRVNRNPHSYLYCFCYIRYCLDLAYHIPLATLSCNRKERARHYMIEQNKTEQYRIKREQSRLRRGEIGKDRAKPYRYRRMSDTEYNKVKRTTKEKNRIRRKAKTTYHTNIKT